MQRQQHASYDLLAVFSDETKADMAEAKLHREGFGENEVFRLEAGEVSGGQFREHGPNLERRSVFLQTSRSGPNPIMVLFLAILFGLILSGAMFAAHFAITSIPEVPAIIAGAIVGIILGAIIGLTRKGRVRGNIGQDMSKVTVAGRKPAKEERTVIAIRLPDPENISRKSRARAILLNNGGKIDRSVGRDV